MNWKAKCQELAEENRRLREELAKRETAPAQAVERKPRQQRKRK